MPTIKAFAGSKIRMYADDHLPPHFHAVGVDFSVLVRLADMRIMGGRADKRTLQEAIEWAKANREALVARWAELNKRE